MEMEEVAGGFEELLPPSHVLHLGEGEAAEGEGCAFQVEDRLNEIVPGAAGEPQAQRKRVEEQPQHPVAVVALRPAMGEDAGDHVDAADELAEDAEMSREQSALERHGGGAREPL